METKMTVLDVLERAMAMLPSNTAEDTTLTQYAVPWINQGMAEFLYVENSIRTRRGLNTYEFAPVVLTEKDEVPCTYEFIAAVLVYYLASLAAKDDDDYSTFMEYYRRTVEAAAEHSPVSVEMVLDTTFHPEQWKKFGHQFNGDE